MEHQSPAFSLFPNDSVFGETRRCQGVNAMRQQMSQTGWNPCESKAGVPHALDVPRRSGALDWRDTTGTAPGAWDAEALTQLGTNV